MVPLIQIKLSSLLRFAMHGFTLLKTLTAIVLFTSHISASDTICTRVPTATDLASGLMIVTDPTCAASGDGCITTNCRYCRTSPQNPILNLLVCSSIPGASTQPITSAGVDPCTSTLSPGDFTVGVSALSDFSCGSGGLGCFSLSCRFCRLFDTPSSQSYMPCTAILSTPPPSTVAFDLNCSASVSQGDAAVGIAIVTDLSCVLGGVGCASEVCRFCRVRTTAQSQSFMRCSDIDTNDGSDIFFTPLPTDIPNNGIVIGSKDRPVLDLIMFANAVTTAPPRAVNNPCLARVSAGDAAVGISAMRDPWCLFGGIGCFSVSCRFCRLYTTLQSSYMLPCK